MLEKSSDIVMISKENYHLSVVGIAGVGEIFREGHDCENPLHLKGGTVRVLTLSLMDEKDVEHMFAMPVDCALGQCLLNGEMTRSFQKMLNSAGNG